MTGLRRCARQRGALAVEAAFALPVIIAGAMIFLELANIGLTIDMGNTALERAIQEFRSQKAASLDEATMEGTLRTRMVGASHGYLSAENVASVSVEHFDSLDAMGGASEDGGTTAAATTSSGRTVPMWRITVEIRKDFITPLPRLMSMDNSSFRYRYQQLLGYEPTEDSTP